MPMEALNKAQNTFMTLARAHSQGDRAQGWRVVWESGWDVSITVTQYRWSFENAGIFRYPFAVSMETYTSLGTSDESHPINP